MNEVVREFLLESHENLAQLDLDTGALPSTPPSSPASLAPSPPPRDEEAGSPKPPQPATPPQTPIPALVVETPEAGEPRTPAVSDSAIRVDVGLLDKLMTLV